MKNAAQVDEKGDLSAPAPAPSSDMPETRALKGAQEVLTSKDGSSSSSTGSTGSSGKDEASPVIRGATLAELFSTAETLDYILMFFGCCGGIVTGLCIPFFNGT